jgi:MFS family permease
MCGGRRSMTAVGLRTRLGGGLGRSYWWLWMAAAASNLADGVFWIALPLLAIQLTDSPVLVAGVAIAARLPWLVFALVAGALADRLDRRRTMVLVNFARVLLVGSLGVAVMLDLASLPLLYVVAFVLGMGETLFDTSAQSIIPNLVDRDKLSRANGRLYGIEIVMNQFVGPPIGGLLAAVGIAAAFGTSAIGYLLAGFALTAIVGAFRPIREGPATSIRADIAEGLRYLAAHRVLRTLAIMTGVTNMAAMAMFSVFVLYAVAPGPLGLSEIGFGILMTTTAAGSIVGSLGTEALERRLGRSNLLAAAVLVNAVTLAIPALIVHPIAVGAAFFVGGSTVVAWNIVVVSLRQRIVPDRLLGRVNASYRLLAWGTMPIGAALGGVVGEALGLRAVFLLAAAASGLLILGRLIVTDAAIAAAEAASEQEAAVPTPGTE